MFTQIYTSHAPEAVGPYSQAIRVDNWVYVSGQIGLSPETMQLVGDTTADQAQQVLQNLTHILQEADLSWSHVIKTEMFLVDMSEFPQVNQIYSEFLPDNYQPARQALGVRELPLGARLEMSVIAHT